MKKFVIILISAIFLPLMIFAQEAENRKWQANLYGGLYLENEQAWIIEPSITWHFHKYLGISMGLEFTSQYLQPLHTAVINGMDAYTDDNTKNIGWMVFKPSLHIKSPAVWANKDNGYALWFQFEPGVNLACPFRNSATYKISAIPGINGPGIDCVSYPNKDIQWFYWNTRISANFSVERFVVGVGYSLSNFDYYSCRRNIQLPDGTKYYVPEKEFSQSIFLSIGYRF